MGERRYERSGSSASRARSAISKTIIGVGILPVVRSMNGEQPSSTGAPHAYPFLAIVLRQLGYEARMGDVALYEFGPGIWTSEGPIISFFGFRYPTRMAVIRLPNRGLFVWSPVALSTTLKQDVDALGSVRCLVSPSRLHHLYLGEWKSAYPSARLYASPDLRAKRKDLAFDADLGDAPESEWAGEIDQAPVRGSFLTEVVFFHRESGTAIFADLVQNFPPDWFASWRGVLARLDGICAPNPGPPREWRATFFNRGAARASLRAILSWPIERVLMAHGDPVCADGLSFVRRAFGWLL